MRSSARFKLLVASLAALVTRAGRGASPDAIGESKRADVPRGRDRTRVPLGRRLADFVAADGGGGGGGGRRSSRPTGAFRAPRRYEIEAIDDDAADGARPLLLVEEVRRTAVTGKTTYGFPESRDFDPGRIDDVAILASDPREAGGITIVSVNGRSGDVRGLRRGRTGRAHRISLEDDGGGGRRLRLSEMERALGEVVAGKDWACGAAHAHDDDPARFRDHRASGEEDRRHHDRDHRHQHQHESVPLNADFARSGFDFEPPDRGGASYPPGGWIADPDPGYSFHVDISIDVDASFVEKQGGAEAAVEYVNVLLSAANVVFEHEVDAHLNIVHIQETDIYDQLTSTKDALREMRMHPKPYDTHDRPFGTVLHHAMLGRYVGGGIAFIDSVCDEQWGYGVTSDLSGTLSNIDEMVLFDFFIVTHEIGHSLGSGHTFDAYDPPVDECGACTVKAGEDDRNPAKSAVEGLPRENAATLMSYCNFCDGGLSNIAITMGGVWDGVEPRGDLSRWVDHPDIVGRVSLEPRRVSHNVWRRLASKGGCVRPPADPLPVRGCNDVSDCDDGNPCTIDACDGSGLCAATETLDGCCGNGECEAGEGGRSCPYDCGPFRIGTPRFCEICQLCDDERCHETDGFMIDVGLSDEAERRIFVTSIGLAYSTPYREATVDVYVTTGGSYEGREGSAMDWEKVASVTVSKYNQKRGMRTVEIELVHSFPVGVGERRGLYLAASEDIVTFGERPYSVRNEHGVELRSDRAVSGLFGDGISGFALNCEVGYVLDGGAAEASDGGPGDISGDGPAAPAAPADEFGRDAVPEDGPPTSSPSADPTGGPVAPAPPPIAATPSDETPREEDGEDGARGAASGADPAPSEEDASTAEGEGRPSRDPPPGAGPPEGEGSADPPEEGRSADRPPAVAPAAGEKASSGSARRLLNGARASTWCLMAHVGLW